MKKNHLKNFNFSELGKKRTGALSTWQLLSRQNYRNKAAVSRNNQQIRIAQTDRTFIVRYRSIPPLLFITETPNLLGRLFISTFSNFFLHAKQRVHMTGRDVTGRYRGPAAKNEKCDNRAIESSRVTEGTEPRPTRPWQLHLQANCRRHVELLHLYFD